MFRRLATLACAVSCAATLAATPAFAAPADSVYTYAVIGDVPYGAEQIAAFPQWIDQINADKAVRSVFHLGDIKNGSSECSDDYFEQIRTQFDRFAQPLIYTPGDNEWTDCHRANNGAYNPLERLSTVREVFFDAPGRTLGQRSQPVASQSALGIPENVSLSEHGVAMATLHVVGSNDGLQPWTGIGRSAVTPEQVADEAQRMAGAVAQVASVFAQATQRRDRAVALYLQADMFDPTTAVEEANFGAFRPLVNAIARGAATFGKPVYLFNGDSHAYTSDTPLSAGSPWLDFYGAPAVPNLSRITVDGSANNQDYLRVNITRPGSSPDVLTWEQVPYLVP
ncbi:MAG: metallophosphoesterase [Rhodococcus sp. (in: high G+C Gram-positive bacteria)]